jgi:hypothetical protein
LAIILRCSQQLMKQYQMAAWLSQYLFLIRLSLMELAQNDWHIWANHFAL